MSAERYDALDEAFGIRDETREPTKLDGTLSRCNVIIQLNALCGICAISTVDDGEIELFRAAEMVFVR